jgi:hypothetical protein
MPGSKPIRTPANDQPIVIPYGFAGLNRKWCFATRLAIALVAEGVQVSLPVIEWVTVL